MARPAGRCFQAAERRRTPAAAAKRLAASGRRGGYDLPEIARHSTHRGLAMLGDGHATARTSRRSCRGIFKTRSYPQILLKTLFCTATESSGDVRPSGAIPNGRVVATGGAAVALTASVRLTGVFVAGGVAGSAATADAAPKANTSGSHFMRTTLQGRRSSHHASRHSPPNP
jgi:hypothetical protein